MTQTIAQRIFELMNALTAMHPDAKIDAITFNDAAHRVLEQELETQYGRLANSPAHITSGRATKIYGIDISAQTEKLKDSNIKFKTMTEHDRNYGLQEGDVVVINTNYYRYPDKVICVGRLVPHNNHSLFATQLAPITPADLAKLKAPDQDQHSDQDTHTHT